MQNTKNMVYDINWYVDDENSKEILKTLPKEVILPDSFNMKEDDVTDFLYYNYGHCNLGFKVKEIKTKKLNVTIVCQAVYNSSLEVPDDMTIEDAIEYAKQHLDSCNIETPLEYISGSDELDEENCDFEE